MKRKISVRLSEQVLKRLEAAAQRSGASKSALVEAALEHFLNPDAQTIGDGYLEMSAGVQEDASQGRFPGEAHNPYR